MATAEDHALAARVATAAGEHLVKVREELFAAGTSSWNVGDVGDSEAHLLIAEALAQARPDDGFLSEEGQDDLERLNKPRVWIIDPLDGTNEFSQKGRSDWAVHVALTEGGKPTAGAVALPALGVTFCTDPPPQLPPMGVRAGADGGAGAGGASAAASEASADRPFKPRIVVSRTRPSGAALIIARELDGELIPLGSAGAKAMAVVMGHADIYAHSGGQYEWDNCAPAAVAEAAGLHTSRCDGSELEYNYADPWLPDFLICRTELAEQALAALHRETTRRR